MPVASTVKMALSHVEGVSDSARARELYKYVHDHLEVHSGHQFYCSPPSCDLFNSLALVFWVTVTVVSFTTQLKEIHATAVANMLPSRYYQPSSPINQDIRFPVPAQDRGSPSDEIEEPSDVNIKSDITSSKISSPDTALTAFCQLTAWRIGAQRAMIR